MSSSLEGFTSDTFTWRDRTRPIYRIGSGPAVIVLAELPGITPAVADFARRVARMGCTAVVPSLFGKPGKAPNPRYLARSAMAVCVSREFTLLARRSSSPITDWLRALARAEHRANGGPGVGVVGMCLTGGFALAMAVDETVVAPVMAQPTLPFPISPYHTRELALSSADLARVRERVEVDDLCVIGLRFTGDRFAPRARFARLRRELGDGFLAVEIDSSPTNAHGIDKKAHSVLTEELVDEPSHPTRAALETVLLHLRKSLLPGSR